MKFNNTIKIFIIGLIILICLYVLYFSATPIYEGLNNINCSSCEVKPSLGKCIPIKDLSVNGFGDNIQNINFDIIDTSYVFCPWTPKCNDIKNIVSQTKKQELLNENIQNGLDNTEQCCPDDNFYKSNTVNINILPQFQNMKNICDKINNSKNLVDIKNKLGKDYLQLSSLCAQPDMKGLYFNKVSNLSPTAPNASFEYKLLDTTSAPLGDNYVLQANEFFNCFGNKKKSTTVDDISFSPANIQEFETHNYLDVDSNAPYTTMQDYKQRPYPSRDDFEMELKNLPPLNSSGNVPVSVINTYLTAINGFYEKQLAGMIGPRTHAVPQTLQFDNDSLTTKPSTFFVYDASSNNTYDCEPSITGNDKFKYCGPPSASNYTTFSS
jgi:hypothetical protein